MFLFHFRWLSYIPKRKGVSLPISPQFYDPIDRPRQSCLRQSHPRQSHPSSHVFNKLSMFIFHFRWLSYIPKRKGASLPISPQFCDPIDRPVEYCPSANQVYDPRWLFEGQIDEKDDYLSGFFDRGSFDEIMSGWAKTVVTGRARLGNKISKKVIYLFFKFFQIFRKLIIFFQKIFRWYSCGCDWS